jgi:hypothetical protein
LKNVPDCAAPAARWVVAQPAASSLVYSNDHASLAGASLIWGWAKSSQSWFEFYGELD